MTHMYFSAEGRISYGHLGSTNSCYYYKGTDYYYYRLLRRSSTVHSSNQTY